MTQESTPFVPQTNPNAGLLVPGITLRSLLDEARSQKAPIEIEEAVAWIVPLCVEVADLHAQGFALKLHPSNVVSGKDGVFHFAREAAARDPSHPSDQACMAPELHPGQPGDARASVYAVGAMLYELVTLETVGPGMRRPREVVADLPAMLDTILGKALVTNAIHRPDDLYALAQAIHHLAPPGTVPPPPPADESRLDHAGDLEVDVSLSLLPPPRPPLPGPLAAGAGFNLGVAAPRAAPSSGDAATLELANLKRRLEADPKPHYVVVKDGMDHGPFTAVELLQQITTNAFVEADLLRDTASGREAPLGDFADFAPFAEHAQRHREIKEEKEAIVRVAAQESKATKGKALAGLSIVAVILVGVGTWFLTQHGERSDAVAMHQDTATNIEAEGNLNVPLKKKGGSRITGTRGGIPMLAGGMSCEAAQAAYVEEIKMGGGGQADITRGQYAGIMNNGSYFSHCGVPMSMDVNICAAVQNGRAVGITVVTNPRNPKLAGCIAGGVRNVKFPAHPKLDVVRVSFAGQ